MRTNTSWDTIVIGSGPGGLTAALALACKGQRVLVLEQHYLPGGWTHSFTLGGYRFSPGVHYIGELGVGGGIRRLYEALGMAKHLDFLELNPDGFDHFLIDGERFDQPKGFARWKERLVARFPHERAGLDRYFATMHQVVRELQTVDALLSFPQVLTVPFRAPNLLRWGFRTLSALLDDCIKDPMLRAVLSAQCGNHGLPPSRVSLPAHAAMSYHYNDGGYYPRGGAKAIPRAYIKELRRRGSAIRMRTRVTQILVEKGRAVGVRLESGEEIRAASIVCNADPAMTYGKLLPREYCRMEMQNVRRMTYSVGLLSIFCAVEMDLRGMGYDSGNYWYYRNKDVGGVYAFAEKSMPGARVDGMFLTITTLKDPGHAPHGHHTLEMFTFVPYEPFAAWAATPPEERPAAYHALKKELAGKMMEAAENVIPGIREHVKFLEVGTPLTNDFYCETYRGASYGTAKTPWQLGPLSFNQRGPVKGLHMVGASTLSHGVGGASMSGLFAAQHVLGLTHLDDLLGPGDGSLKTYPSDRPEEWMTKVGHVAEEQASV